MKKSVNFWDKNLKKKLNKEVFVSCVINKMFSIKNLSIINNKYEKKI